jgi:hypothetical protein
MNRRRFLFLGAMSAAGAALAATTAEAALPRLASTPATPSPLVQDPAAAPLPAEMEELLHEAQGWGPPPHRDGPPGRGGPPPRRRRRRRCWMENVRVRYVDRFGRVNYRIERREVCR